MQAELYIMGESFAHNKLYSAPEIEEKIKRLAEDVRIINKHSDSNTLYSNFSAVYPVEFHSTFTIEDFLCRPISVKKSVDRDVVNAMLNIFERATNTSITSQEVIEVLLPEHNNEICHGLIVFHKVEGVADELQLVYGLESWYRFRRHFLGLYPNTGTFVEECSKYFDKLFFHERNDHTIQPILGDFSISIVKHLGFLNDVLFTYRKRTFENESVKYQTLTSECNLEADAASKDKNDAKEKLSFDFINKNGQSESVICYPHLRLCRSDYYPGDSHYYQHRIYFHEGVESIEDGNILIGHIGEHL